MKKAVLLIAAALLVHLTAYGAPLASNEAWVIMNNLALWQDQPNGTLKSIGIFPLGARVTLLDRASKFKQDGKDQDFLRVRTSDKREGWVRSQYVAAQSSLAAVLADKAAVYSGPGAGKVTARYISTMTVVAVVLKESTPDFASIRCYDVSQDAFFGGGTYVAMKDLALASEDVAEVIQYWMAAGTTDLAKRRGMLRDIVAAHGGSEFLPRIFALLGGVSKPTFEMTGKYFVTADKVNVRASPDERNGQVIGQVNTDDQVDALEQTVDSYTIKDQTAPWFRIKEPPGWVFGAFIEPLK